VIDMGNNGKIADMLHQNMKYINIFSVTPKRAQQTEN